MDRSIIVKITTAVLAIMLAAVSAAACAPNLPTALPATQPAATSVVLLPQITQPTVQPAAPGMRTVESAEFGISLAYPEALAKTALVEQAAAVPLSQNIMFAEAHPASISVRFGGYALNRPFQLTYPLSEPQVNVYRTADFAAYGSNSVHDFPSSQARLAELLASQSAAQRCAAPPTSNDDRLPYLPWTNAAQVFCAQVKQLEFGGAGGLPHGRGIRYLTSFSQGIEPVSDQTVFYTFQGLTDDGAYYVSAVFPVATGVFPTEDTQPSADLNAIRDLLAKQILTLNDRPAGQFTPALDNLDQVIESIKLK